jgi:hypothetical protein
VSHAGLFFAGPVAVGFFAVAVTGLLTVLVVLVVLVLLVVGGLFSDLIRVFLFSGDVSGFLLSE